MICLYIGARNGTFNEIPREFLTLELFKIQSREGCTALHVAAKKCTLNQIPEEFITRETLSLMDSCGRTPVHFAAEYGKEERAGVHLALLLRFFQAAALAFASS